MSLATCSGWRQPHGAGIVPDLLLHFDGSLRDAATGGAFATPPGTLTFTNSMVPGFGEDARYTVVSGLAGAVGLPGSERLNLSGQPFTVEGRSYFEPGDSGGILVSKSYYPSEPSGESVHSWTIVVRPDSVALRWGSSGRERSAIVPEGDRGAPFAWAFSDDGEFMRVYVNGTGVAQLATTLSDAQPIPTNNAQVSVFNALSGFLGSTPDWGVDFYVGRVDELRVVIGRALYTGGGYPLATRPFSPD